MTPKETTSYRERRQQMHTSPTWEGIRLLGGSLGDGGPLPAGSPRRHRPSTPPIPVIKWEPVCVQGGARRRFKSHGGKPEAPEERTPQGADDQELAMRAGGEGGSSRRAGDGTMRWRPVGHVTHTGRYPGPLGHKASSVHALSEFGSVSDSDCSNGTVGHSSTR